MFKETENFFDGSEESRLKLHFLKYLKNQH